MRPSPTIRERVPLSALVFCALLDRNASSRGPAVWGQVKICVAHFGTTRCWLDKKEWDESLPA